jgi:hypothetical protein
MDAISQIFVTYLVNGLWQVPANCRNVWALCQTDASFTCDLSSLFVGPQCWPVFWFHLQVYEVRMLPVMSRPQYLPGRPPDAGMCAWLTAAPTLRGCPGGSCIPVIT